MDVVLPKSSTTIVLKVPSENADHVGEILEVFDYAVETGAAGVRVYSQIDKRTGVRGVVEIHCATEDDWKRRQQVPWHGFTISVLSDSDGSS